MFHTSLVTLLIQAYHRVGIDSICRDSADTQYMLIIESVDSIIESVDSICRDSADTQYTLIQTNFSKSPKQLTYKPL